MIVKKIAGKCDQCGGPTKKPKKGDKLDTQLFPDCKGTKYDRDVVKKTEKSRKKAFNLKGYRESQKQDI